MNPLVRIGLGTAQWGLEYGIANRLGQPPEVEVAGMIEAARASGIDLLDTAGAYGTAESIIGAHAATTQFRIVTKVGAGDTSPSELSDAIARNFSDSLRRLNRHRVYGLLVHDAAALLGPDGDRLWQLLETLLADGRVERLGVSVYAPEQLEAVRARFPITLVQLPCNVFDQRFLKNDYLHRLVAEGVEIHLRSAFLQGLLLMPTYSLPEHFAGIRTHHGQMLTAMHNAGWSMLEAALGFCLAQAADRVIVGCESVGQLRGIITAVWRVAGHGFGELARFAVEDEQIILPTKWPRAKPHAASG